MQNLTTLSALWLGIGLVVLVWGLLLGTVHTKRFQYHQQILNKANTVSYRFGYLASDDPNNPHSRDETSLEPGHVTGSYSFVDANNLRQFVQYESHPKHGFRIVKQWNRPHTTTGQR